MLKSILIARSAAHLLAALPERPARGCRTGSHKEPGALAEPPYPTLMMAWRKPLTAASIETLCALSAAATVSKESLVRNACWRYSVNCGPPQPAALTVGTL